MFPFLTGAAIGLVVGIYADRAFDVGFEAQVAWERLKAAALKAWAKRPWA